MTGYFADTWYLIARLDRTDEHHEHAMRLERSLARVPLVTHDGVLVEFLTFFAEHGPTWRSASAEIVHALPSEGVEVVPQDRALFLRALRRYEQRLDNEYSLVDCMTMVLMEERGITHVLTNDHHFTQAGFTIVNQ